MAPTIISKVVCMLFVRQSNQTISNTFCWYIIIIDRCIHPVDPPCSAPTWGWYRLWRMLLGPCREPGFLRTSPGRLKLLFHLVHCAHYCGRRFRDRRADASSWYGVHWTYILDRLRITIWWGVYCKIWLVSFMSRVPPWSHLSHPPKLQYVVFSWLYNYLIENESNTNTKHDKINQI